MDDLKKLSAAQQATGGKGLAILAEQSNSPSRARLQKLIAAKLPQARWYEYEPVDFDIHRRAATLAFGQPVAPHFKLETAKVIVALDCGFHRQRGKSPAQHPPVLPPGAAPGARAKR